ncbi:MAG: rRNA maturation RNase YbeY [Gemmatimonadota bacterium]
MTATLHLNRLGEWPAAAGLGPVIEAAVRATLAAGNPPAGGEISITLVSEEEIRELNRRYLGRDRETDVLAFDLGGEADLLADVYVAPTVAARSARECGETEAREIVRLVIHGMLHALGHDHPEGEARYESEMFRLQEELLDRLNV